MKQMTKLLAALLAVMLIAGVLMGCGNTTPEVTTGGTGTPEETTGTMVGGDGTTAPAETTGKPTETTLPAIRPFETTTKVEEPVDPVYVYEGFTPIPLLVIKVNYAPASGTSTLLKYNDDTYFNKMLFSDDDLSMKSFYSKISDGNFYFTPAAESFENAARKNVKNDGIVEVTVKMEHPGGTSSAETGAAIAEAAKYVDFKSFDKNGNGSLSKDEFAIAFITAGYEKTRSNSTPSHNAYYKGATFTAGGVGIGCGFVMVGEMMNDSTPITVGSFCHELSHFLGTVDLYTNKNWGGANSPAGKVSVMAGNGSAGKNNGEMTGKRPSYLDAYHLVALKFQPCTVIGDGEYTLYSRQSTEGKYGILKIETPNPNEYYLIENRYWDNSSSHFDSDTNKEGTRGVIIWHVDENYATASKGGSASGGGNNGEDIGVAALAPRKEGGDLVFPANSGVFGKKGQIFNCEDYDFPLNHTWNTSVNEVWNDFFRLRIEILTDAGHEMKIKVSGTKKGDFPIGTSNVGGTSTTVAVKGQVENTHGMRLKGITIQLSTKWDFSEILQEQESVVTTEGTYGALFTGLAPKTLYYTRVMFHFVEGDMYLNGDTITKNGSSDTTKCTVFFFRGLQANDKPFEQKFNAGAKMEIKFPMKKEGFTFEGWYIDPAMTEKYDVNKPCEAGDLILFAKWVKNS